MAKKGTGTWLVAAAGAALLIVMIVTATALLRSGEDDAARDAETQQELAEAHEAADFYINTEKLAEARLILERLAERFPDDARTHALMAKLLMAEDRFDKAYTHADRSVGLDDGNHESQFLTALLAEVHGDFEKARDHYARATELAPQVAAYAMYLAQSMIRLDELDAAWTQLERARRLDATLSQTYSMQAEVVARQGDLDRALDLVDQALEREAKDSRHHVSYTLQKADLLRRDDKPEAAQTVLMELSPEQQQEQRVVEQLAAGHLALDRPDRAAAVWAELFALEPGNAKAAAEAGKAFIAAERYGQAEQYHELARQVSTSNEAVLELEEALQSAD